MLEDLLTPCKEEDKDRTKVNREIIGILNYEGDLQTVIRLRKMIRENKFDHDTLELMKEAISDIHDRLDGNRDNEGALNRFRYER